MYNDEMRLKVRRSAEGKSDGNAIEISLGGGAEVFEFSEAEQAGVEAASDAGAGEGADAVEGLAAELEDGTMGRQQTERTLLADFFAVKHIDDEADISLLGHEAVGVQALEGPHRGEALIFEAEPGSTRPVPRARQRRNFVLVFDHCRQFLGASKLIGNRETSDI
jgi:hypothetical protein